MERSATQLNDVAETWRRVRAVTTGVMGYLAMLQDGSFKGHEAKVTHDLLPELPRLQKLLVELKRTMDELNPDGQHSRLIDDAHSATKKLHQHLSRRLEGGTVTDVQNELELIKQVVRAVGSFENELKTLGVQTRVPETTVATEPEEVQSNSSDDNENFPVFLGLPLFLIALFVFGVVILAVLKWAFGVVF